MAYTRETHGPLNFFADFTPEQVCDRASYTPSPHIRYVKLVKEISAMAGPWLGSCISFPSVGLLSPKINWEFLTVSHHLRKYDK